MNSKHKKVSKLSDDMPLKKDGYAKGGVHKSMIPVKPGKPYSGPPMATGKH